jgi:hypothetical protein
MKKRVRFELEIAHFRFHETKMHGMGDALDNYNGEVSLRLTSL